MLTRRALAAPQGQVEIVYLPLGRAILSFRFLQDAVATAMVMIFSPERFAHGNEDA